MDADAEKTMWLKILERENKRYLDATTRWENRLRAAVEAGVPYTDIARVIDKSESAVRQLSQRREWVDTSVRRNAVPHV